ncbi:MAG: hypothetical protein IPN94_10835 [Sphingobacteriales bacterium]|nr:hypothetical protein [Sphingobacteriales bacterium]
MADAPLLWLMPLLPKHLGQKTRELDELDKITKADVVDFVNRRFKNNYVVVYKKQGEDAAAAKIPKPQITPVALNREAQSDFAKQFDQMSEMT